MRKIILIAACTLSAHTAFAQQPPSSGSILQQIPPVPALQRPVPDVRIEQGGKPPASLAADVRIRVNSLSITGQSVYPEPELLALTGFRPGSDLSLTELRAMADRITDHYRRNGYVVAQAYLPAQDIKDGVVRIAVIEGRYGQIQLRNSSNLADGLANGLLGGLNQGDTITIAPLEERLLLLSDIPGVGVRSTLVPGAAAGTSDLIVDIVPGRRVTGSVEADNHGNRYTGEYRVGGAVHLNNLAGQGDVLSFRGLGARGLAYGRISYQAQFGRATVGIAYTALAYKLGREFAGLGAHGTAQVVSLYGSYPLIRSRNTNLYALAGFDAKTFQDKIDLTSSVTDRKIGVANLGIAGDHRDRFFGGGFNAYSLVWSPGSLDIETPAARAADALTARSNGSYNKLSFHAARLQTLSGPFSLYGSIRGQVASKNLDISEKMQLGGAYGVRAYPEGEAYADQGYLANVEARMLLPTPRELAGQLHLVGFVDWGAVTLNKNPWLPGPNTRRLSGAGVGLTWADYNNFVVRAYYAFRLGDEVATSAPDKKGRFWIQGVKYF
jgi:hemolysin activation/secretion protein